VLPQREQLPPREPRVQQRGLTVQLPPDVEPVLLRVLMPLVLRQVSLLRGAWLQRQPLA
jgi:hypothetical protein